MQRNSLAVEFGDYTRIISSFNYARSDGLALIMTCIHNMCLLAHIHAQWGKCIYQNHSAILINGVLTGVKVILYGSMLNTYDRWRHDNHAILIS